jgi:hypothetical protein
VSRRPLADGEPATGNPPTATLVLNQHVSRRLRRKPHKNISSPQLTLPFRQANDSLPQFWQPCFYDFNVRSQTKFVEKLRYMHMYPTKRELVTHPRTGPGAFFPFTRRRKLDWSASILGAKAGLEKQDKSPALKSVKDGPPSQSPEEQNQVLNEHIQGWYHPTVRPCQQNKSAKGCATRHSLTLTLSYDAGVWMALP